jgi:short subunit dehydrogenase-like uncharacterized protein
MVRKAREFDLVLYGATGFTGQLVAEYLRDRYGVDGDLRWAIAGRSRRKLEQLGATLGEPEMPMITADSDDEAALAAMVSRTAVICTTVGPYALYGSALVAACAAAGTHYCDLTGETQWMRRMIDAHQAAAEHSGARIVHTCGFDSIPSDLGVLFLQAAMMDRHGVPARHIKYRVAKVTGTFSGGTVASLINVLDEAGRDRSLRRLLADPYALNPAGSERGDDVNDQLTARFDPDFQRWTLPFVMAAINTRVVRRTNVLLDYPYGRDFRYDEAVLAPKGRGALTAHLAAGAMTAGTAALALPPLRALARRLLPSPGEGPDRATRERGSFRILLHGAHPSDRSKDLFAEVCGDMDPGYGSTAKMLGESAVCLAKDALDCGGGFWTPASAMGQRLIARLERNAGLSFTLLEDRPGDA